MKSRGTPPALPVTAIALMALAALGGCGKLPQVPQVNERPIVQLTRAPLNSTTRFSYSYLMDWNGYDPDGRIVYYLYAVDPPHATAANPRSDTAWVQTSRQELTVNFGATQPDTSVRGHRGASDFHVFVLKAIDNGGLQSEPVVRAFFTYTIAPTCAILSPVPRDGSVTYVAPSVRVRWTGQDEDGIFDSKKPVKYRYVVLDNSSSAVSLSAALADPDSVRRYYAPRNWAGWDSTSADTTWAQLRDLTPDRQYMFCVVSFDEAGAYSPIFNKSTNMLQMQAKYAAQSGPALIVYNDFFYYAYTHGTYSTLPQYHIPIEVPAGQTVTINWTWDPCKSSGSTGGPPPCETGLEIRSFQWALDIEDPYDNTPRNPERTDLRHWSAPDPNTTTATVGPFAGGEFHMFYIRAEDSNGLQSLGIVDMTFVQSPLNTPLGIVNDFRLPTDQLDLLTGCPTAGNSSTRWPTQAELDTFLYARGWVPWGRPQCANGAVTRPGVFAGYTYETLGTRTGLPSVREPLSAIGRFAHLVWITDDQGCQYDAPGAGDRQTTALSFMCKQNRANSVGAYVHQGGEVWFVGGGVAFASTIDFNKTTNDGSDPRGVYGRTFSASANELGPGRLMYDLCHWQSEIKVFVPTSPTMTRFLGRMDSTRSNSSLNPDDYATYQTFPPTLRLKSLVRGDSLPPQRAASPGSFYQTRFALEYTSDENRIVEDTDPSPFVDNEQSTLDTIYYARASGLLAPSFNTCNVIMTRYWGPGTQKPVIFTGFNIWNLTFADCRGIVDGVLYGLWKLPVDPSRRSPPARMRPVLGPTRAWPPPAATSAGRTRAGPGVVAAARSPGR
jgi:hypothetical protein